MVKLIVAAFFWLHDSGQRALGQKEQKIDDLNAVLDKARAMNQAAADSPSSKQALIDALKKSKICIYFLLFSLSCCTNQIASLCPSVHNWTQKEENEMAASLDFLPEGSPLIGMAEEWARLRAEAKACQNNG